MSMERLETKIIIKKNSRMFFETKIFIIQYVDQNKKLLLELDTMDKVEIF